MWDVLPWKYVLILIMVGTDEHQHPVEVPGLIFEGVTQQIENEAAQKRAKLWKIRRQEGF